MIKYTEEQLNRSGIYMITNIENCKCYIGQTQNFKKRWQKGYNKYLTAAFKKYGKEAFDFEILMYCDVADLTYHEQRMMNAYSPEYNLAPAAGSNRGYKYTEETKQKMSAARKGKPNPKSSAAQKGKPKSKVSVAQGITPELETKVCQDYQNEKQSFCALGRKYKISHNTVKRILIRNNII